MDKKKIFVFLLATVFVFSLINIVSAEECPWWNPLGFWVECGEEENNNSIGYEFLSDGSVVHMWNEIDHYYFNKSSGIQFTNHYDDYWTKNIFCLGYYDNGEWNKIKCSDELSGFNKNIETDNETYVNATLWKDISFSGYDFRLGVQYHLGLNDKNLSVTIYGKNIGIDIPYDIGFGWIVKDIKIGEGPNDAIIINDTYYNLNESMNILLKDIKNIHIEYNYSEENYHEIIPEENWTVVVPLPYYVLHGINENAFISLHWDKDLDYAVKMNGDGNQENFSVSLLINAGGFNSGQEKSTTLYWRDPETRYEWNTATDTGQFSLTSTAWVSMAFTVGTVGTNENFDISKVVLKMWDDGSPGTITVDIHAADGSQKPTGPSLSSGTTNGETLGGIPGIWRDITMSPYNLQASKTYTIVVHASGSQALLRHAGTEYTGGQAWGSSNSGSTWTYNGAPYDIVFEVWGAIPTVYSLNIIDPNTGSPESVSSGDNITITFNFTEDGANITSGVTMENVTIGGSDAIIITSESSGFPLTKNFTVDGSSTGSSSLNCDKPTDVISGDLLLLIAMNDDSSATAFTDNKAGWNFIDTSGDGNSDAHVAAWWRAADGNEDSTETITSQGNDEWICWYVRVTGADITNPINDFFFSQLSPGNPTSVTGVTTGVDNTLVFYGLSFDGGDGSPFSVSGTGWEERDEFQTGTTGNSDVSGTWGNRNLTIAGASGTATVTAASSDGRAYFQFAIAPDESQPQQFGFISGVGWQVNVTVPTFASGLKDLYLNATYLGNTRNDTETEAINYAAPTDTCTYSSGNWEVDCSDDCSISSPVDVGGNDISIIGTGTFETSVDISNYGLLHIEGTDSSNICKVTCSGGGCFTS